MLVFSVIDVDSADHRMFCEFIVLHNISRSPGSFIKKSLGKGVLAVGMFQSVLCPFENLLACFFFC